MAHRHTQRLAARSRGPLSVVLVSLVAALVAVTVLGVLTAGDSIWGGGAGLDPGTRAEVDRSG